MADEGEQAERDTGQLDDSEPAPERQAELREAYEANLAGGKAPYEGVWIRTKNELLWILREREWLHDSTIDALEYSSGGSDIWANLRGFGSIGLAEVNLSKARFTGAQLDGVCLRFAKLTGANFSEVELRGAVLDGADLSNSVLESANLTKANLERAKLVGASLYKAVAVRALFAESDLSNTKMMTTRLAGAQLTQTNLQGSNLTEADLKEANLQGAKFNSDTNLTDVTFDSKTVVGDIEWNGVRLMRVNWEQVEALGDEYYAKHSHMEHKTRLEKRIEVRRFEAVVRAYRQLAHALRSQGIDEHADYYQHRAHKIRRIVLRKQHKYARWLWSWFLELLAGYGYEPWQTLVVYVSIIIGFAALYHNDLAPSAHLHLSVIAALVMSVVSFHGRGFFPTPNLPLDSPIAVWGAVEAIVGLVVEASFIATFTNRFFAR